MKILVTVGTTSFNSLIEEIDAIARDFKEFDIISQIGPGEYEPFHHPYFRYEPNIFERYLGRLIITHCGAGSVYSLLEQGKRFIAVPNFERHNLHQIELARYLKREELALVCKRPEDIRHLIVSGVWRHFSPKPYLKDTFFVADDMLAIVDRTRSSKEPVKNAK